MPELLDGQGGVASAELNATIMEWPPGHATAAHTNGERDVLIVVLTGSLNVHVDGVPYRREAAQALVVERGAARWFETGAEGARVLTAHRRRAGLMPGRGRAAPIALELLQALEAPAPSAAGGTAAAAAAAMAASLVVMVADTSAAWDAGSATSASAAGLRDRLLQLGADDVQAFAAVLAAQRSGGDLRAALLEASRVPLAIAGRAADVAELAAATYEHGKTPLRPDASAAAILAEAATRASSRLVRFNLGHPAVDADADDPRLLLRGAAEAEARAQTALQVASP